MTSSEAYDSIDAGMKIMYSALDKACADAFDTSNKDVRQILDDLRVATVGARSRILKLRKKELGDETQG